MGYGRDVRWGWAPLLLCVGCSELAELDALVPREDRSRVVAWSTRFDGAGSQHAHAVAADGDGHTIVAGKFDGTVDFGGGPLTSSDEPDLYVVKLSATGEHVWSVQLGDPEWTRIEGMAVDRASGDIVIAGALQGTLTAGDTELSAAAVDGFVVKLDGAGSVLWARTIGGEGEQRVLDVALNADKSIVIGGNLRDPIQFDDACDNAAELTAARRQVFIARLTRDGCHDASAVFEGDGDQHLGALGVNDDEIVVAGTTEGTMQIGEATLDIAGSNDFFILRLSPALELVWGAAFGDEQRNCHDFCDVDIAFDAQDHVVVAGTYSGAFDFNGASWVSGALPDVFVSRFDAFGDGGAPRHEWSLASSSFEEHRAHAAGVRDGEVVVAGTLGGPMLLGDASFDDALPAARDVFVAAVEDGRARRLVQVINDGDVFDPDDRPKPRMVIQPTGEVTLAITHQGRLAIDQLELGNAADGGMDVAVVTLRVP